MTKEEAKQAFLTSVPVWCAGIKYDEISALIYRKDKARRSLVMTLELADRCGHAVMIVPPDKVSGEGK